MKNRQTLGLTPGQLFSYEIRNIPFNGYERPASAFCAAVQSRVNIHTREENRLATELHKSLQGCLLNCLMKERPCGVLVEEFTFSDEVLCSKLDESVNAELSQ